MFVLGVTGGIGTGKSTVSGYFRDKGVEVLDADEISRKVTDVGGVALPEIAELFGPRALTANGALNRKYVASLVFTEKKKLDKLSSIVHHYVLTTIGEEIAKRLLEELDVGVTYLEGAGAYSGKEKQVIFCVLRKPLSPRAEDIVKKEDPQAFMIVTNATEIYGEGYKSYFGEKL